MEERAVDDDHGEVVLGEPIHPGVLVVQDSPARVVYCYRRHCAQTEQQSGLSAAQTK